MWPSGTRRGVVDLATFGALRWTLLCGFGPAQLMKVYGCLNFSRLKRCGALCYRHDQLDKDSSARKIFLKKTSKCNRVVFSHGILRKPSQ